MLQRSARLAVSALFLVSTAGLTASTVGSADAQTVSAGGSASVAKATTAAATVDRVALARMRAKPAKTVSGTLNTLNNSGVYGKVSVRIKGLKATVRVTAYNLAAGLPHAAHLHFTATAAHKCPTNAQDANGDGRLNVAEGVPVYGGIVKSLTTKGDTSPNSALAVDRFPATRKEVYKRTMRVSLGVAKGLRSGESLIVVHGVDYNNNGAYDLGDRGPSEIAPSLPAEATDPAACGKLR